MNETFVTPTMNDMSPDLLELIRTRINSFIKWDLVKFFHQNPNTTDTAENVAKYIGRHQEAVEPELETLVNDAILLKDLLGKTTVYRLTDDTPMQTLVAQFITACADRHFRIKAVYHILRGMG